MRTSILQTVRYVNQGRFLHLYFGGRVLEGRGAGHQKIFVCQVFKYAVFDIKATYNYQIFIPDVQLYSVKFRLGGSGEADLWLEGRGPLPLPSPLRTAPNVNDTQRRVVRCLTADRFAVICKFYLLSSSVTCCWRYCNLLLQIWGTFTDPLSLISSHLISSHFIWPLLGWPHFMWTEWRWVRSEATQFAVAANQTRQRDLLRSEWSQPRRIGSLHGSDETRSLEMRSDRIRRVIWTLF